MCESPKFWGGLLAQRCRRRAVTSSKSHVLISKRGYLMLAIHSKDHTRSTLGIELAGWYTRKIQFMTWLQNR
jgi:hypothetical protein